MTRNQAILEEINRGCDFAAHKMLLIRDEGRTAKNAAFAAWAEGPEGADKRIAEFKKEMGV